MKIVGSHGSHLAQGLLIGSNHSPGTIFFWIPNTDLSAQN